MQQLSECNENWDTLLKVFHKLEQERPKNHREKIEILKTTAKNTVQLTQRQREGIMDRCNNVLNDSYGNTKQGVVMKTV